MPLKNLIVSIIMLMIGGSYLYLTSGLPDRSIQNVPGPAFFPAIVSGFIIILALALLIQNALRIGRQAMIEHELVIPWRAIMVLLWFVGFLVILPYTGFLIASMPFFAGLMLLCERRKALYVAAGAIIIPVLLYLLFRQGFNILLPTGPWM